MRTDDGRTQVERVRGAVPAAAARIARRPDVLSAHPELDRPRQRLHPERPRASGQPGGWQQIQWNFLAGTGVNAPDAWENLDRRRPARRRRASIVAVLDTGVAYRDRGKFRRSPDLARQRFRKGYDFVDNDAYPLDHNGHGTHVASTIAETANNGIGLVGLAYGARIMPVRVLDRLGEGDSRRHRRAASASPPSTARKIINLSFEFSSTVTARPDPGHPRRAALRPPRARWSSAPPGNASAQRRRLPRPRHARSCRSARSPSTAARPSTPTPAPASTSSPPAAAPTPSSPTPAATPPSSPAATSSR